MDTSQMVVIGKVTAPFGVRGSVKVEPYSDYLERCHLLDWVWLEGQNAAGYMRVIKARLHKNAWVLDFESCETRQQAEQYKNALLKIPHSERVSLPPDTYYFDQIIGLEAFTMGREKIGVVKDIIRTGSNDVYVLEGEDQREILVPALKDVVKEVNLEEGHLLLELPPGLKDS